MFPVLFVCKCVLYYCHRVATQLQLNISYHTISYQSYLLTHFYYKIALTNAHNSYFFTSVRVILATCGRVKLAKSIITTSEWQ